MTRYSMEISVQITTAPIPETISAPTDGGIGAWVEFRGNVRGEENSQPISALKYEAYPEMAEREISRVLEELSLRHPCLAAKVIHRIGGVPVGEAAIYVGVAAKHRGPAFALLTEFMDRLKQDVPIWKRQAILAGTGPGQTTPPRHVATSVTGKVEPAAVRASDPAAPLALDEAIKKIQSACEPLPAVPVPLDAAFGRILREIICAAEDMPSCDRSTRDGYAILRDDPAEMFQIVDTLHAADWRPRQLKSGEAVRVATGTALPCSGLRVVMQEHAGRNGDNLRILKRETVLNIRRRGEEVKAGQPLVLSGTRLDAGKLSLLAAAGCTQPPVSPRVRVIHFTTGDEIVPPDQTSKAGQIRDSNSILIWALLQSFQVELEQSHLPENFEQAKLAVGRRRSAVENADLVLVSGGASVGDLDFTRRLLEWLGFEIAFSQVDLRPGRPLIFGVNGLRAAFGLPGNPLSHFVCFHFAVARALARLTGGETPQFLRGRLAVALDDAACARETLWPARFDRDGLHPLPWASSGDVTCFAMANALIRVPANNSSLPAGMMVDFLPAGGNLCG